MSKIKRYIAFCEENGYTNEEGEVVSMKYAEEYMKTQQYAKEHDEQTLLEVYLRCKSKNNKNSHPK